MLYSTLDVLWHTADFLCVRILRIALGIMQYMTHVFWQLTHVIELSSSLSVSRDVLDTENTQCAIASYVGNRYTQYAKFECKRNNNIKEIRCIQY